MIKKIIELSYPIKSSDFAHTYSENISDTKNLYEIVDSFEKSVFSGKLKLKTEKNNWKTSLRLIVNLHNKDGIKDVSQIKKMIQHIESGKNILHPSSLPNIKLAKTKENKLVLFDGHHSILAYMFAGRKYLHEVPHLIVLNEQGYVTDKEILVFFGQHSSKLKGKSWSDYVINWQVPVDKQLCKRVQKDVGELFDSINLS